MESANSLIQQGIQMQVTVTGYGTGVVSLYSPT